MNERSITYYEGYDKPLLKPINKMLHTNEDINKKIYNNIGHLKEFQKKYNYNDYLIYLLSIIQISLNDLYGKEINDLFYGVLNDVEIIMGRGRTDKLAKKYGCNVDSTTEGVFTNRDPKNLFTSDLYFPKDKIIMGDKSRNYTMNNIDRLDTLIHELRHALSARLNTNRYMNDRIFYKRCGLNETYYLKYSNDNYNVANILDEVFNVYFTNVLVSNILNYKYNNIDKYHIRRIINELEHFPNESYQSGAYDFEVKLCKPLLFNKELLKKANYAAINGKLGSFKDLFDDYYDYADELEELSDDNVIMYSNDSERKEEYINKVKEFKIKTLNIAERKI